VQSLQAGGVVQLHIPHRALHVFDGETGKRAGLVDEKHKGFPVAG
jgi:hypothetical protein